MRVNKEYISTQNTYSFNQPVYIVIHMTEQQVGNMEKRKEM